MWCISRQCVLSSNTSEYVFIFNQAAPPILERKIRYMFYCYVLKEGQTILLLYF